MIDIGNIVAIALKAMKVEVQPGTTTAEIDRVGAAILKQNAARSAPQVRYGFPAATCISVNDEIVHGIPGDRVLQDGDLVKFSKFVPGLDHSWEVVHRTRALIQAIRPREPEPDTVEPGTSEGP